MEKFVVWIFVKEKLIWGKGKNVINDVIWINVHSNSKSLTRSPYQFMNTTDKLLQVQHSALAECA